MSGSDDESRDPATPPSKYIIRNIVDVEGSTQQVILTLKCFVQYSNGSRLNVYGLGNGSDDDVVLALEGTDTADEGKSKDRGD
jgi:hypothetical protein